MITCTPSHAPILARADIAPGTVIAAVGADSPEKQEPDPVILRDAAVICDLTQQCAAVGELHHAIDGGFMTVSDVRAELADVALGRVVGRRRSDEIIVYDSTGTALQDVAAAALVYESPRILRWITGTAVRLAASRHAAQHASPTG